MARALAEIRAASAAEAGDIEPVVSGPVAVRHEIGRALFADMRLVLPLAVFVTALIAAFTQRSVRGVILPLGAIGIALAATLALFVAAGETLNFVTVIMPPVVFVVLGIAVDDSIHFLSRFNAEARRAANEEEGVERALSAVIRPVTITTLALCCGFLTLTAGSLQSQLEFGVLAAAMLLLAWLLDLSFVPAISHRLRFVTLWEVLTVDLGAAPHETIPLFAGLSHRQARIAAILGRIETCTRGTRVLALGEAGRDILVVIDGELTASIPREGTETVLRTLARGDLIGEVAFFSGKRSANVDARTDARLIRLDDTALARIASRYPRIATILYRNLGQVMATRLEDVTARL